MHRTHPQHCTAGFIRLFTITRCLSSACLLLCLFLAACGGKSDTSSVPLTLTQILPATGVLPGLDEGPALVLSAPIDGATATDETVSLQSPVGAVPPGAIAVAGNRVSFQPAQRLVWGTTYTMRLTPPLASDSGVRLAGPVEQAFRTPAAAWSTPGAVDPTKDVDLTYSQVAMDERGNAFRLTSLNQVPDNNFIRRFVVSRFDAATGIWSERLQLAPTGYAPILKVDPQGNALVVWSSDVPINNQPIDFMASRYDAKSASWSAPVVLQHYDAVANSDGENPIRPKGYDPTLEIDQLGNALVVWNVKIKSPDSSYRVRFVVARYDVKTGSWGTAAEVAIVDGLGRWSLSMAPDGNAILAWTEGVTGGTDALYTSELRMRAAIFDVGTRTWGAPATVGEVAGQMVYPTSKLSLLATSSSGAAAIGWQDPNGMHIAKYSPARAAWDTASTFAGYAGAADLKFDSAGDGVLVMSVRSGAQAANFSVLKSDRDAAIWNEIGTIPLAPGDAGAVPQIAVDPADNLIVTWTKAPQSDVGDKMPAVRYVKKTGLWQFYPALPIPWEAFALHFASTNAAGNLVLLYTIQTGQNSIYTVRYNASDDQWEAPVLLQSGATTMTGAPYTIRPLLATNRSGEAMVFWLEKSGTYYAPAPYTYSSPETTLYFSRLGR